MDRSPVPVPVPVPVAETDPAATAGSPTGPSTSDRPLTRRAMVAGVGALGAGLAVAGCGAPGGSDAPAAPSAGATVGSTPGPASGSAPTSGGTALGPAADVPVGSARIYAEQQVVVTQASAGSYAGFSTECPHQGCAVARVEAAEIICPCHDSRFGLDGAVLQGPARSGLTARMVTVDGDQITVA